MEWITAIIKANTGEDGKVNLDKVAEELKAKAPEHVVPKNMYNDQAAKLVAAEGKVKEAEKTITEMKTGAKSTEDLQKQADDWKTKAEAADATLKDYQRTQEVKEALSAAGAKDAEYMRFKLGTLDYTDDGKAKDLDLKIKDLAEKFPDYFEQQDDGGGGNPKAGGSGFKPIGNKPDAGKPPAALTPEDAFLDAFGKLDGAGDSA